MGIRGRWPQRWRWLGEGILRWSFWPWSRVNDPYVLADLVVGLVEGFDPPLLELLYVLAVLDVRVGVVVALEVLVQDDVRGSRGWSGGEVGRRRVVEVDGRWFGDRNGYWYWYVMVMVSDLRIKIVKVKI